MLQLVLYVRFEYRRSIRLEVLALGGMVFAALLLEPWWTLVAVVVIWTSFSWLISQVTWLGTLNLAEAVIIGFAVALITALVAAVCLVAIRYFRPLPSVPAETAVVGNIGLEGVVKKHTAIIENQLEKRIEIETKIEKMTGQLREIAEDRKAIIHDYQRMSGVEITLKERIDKVETATRDYAKGINDALIVKVATEAGERVGVEQKLSERLDEHRKMIQEIEVSFRAFSDATRFSILAIYHRERLLSLAALAEENATKLLDAFDGGKILSDEQWTPGKPENFPGKVISIIGADGLCSISAESR